MITKVPCRISESNQNRLLSCFILIQPDQARLTSLVRSTTAASQNLNGAHVRVLGFWSGSELDRFVWDKAALGSLIRKDTESTGRPDCPPAGGNTQLTNGFWRSPRWRSSILSARWLRPGGVRPMINSRLVKWFEPNVLHVCMRSNLCASRARLI